MDPAISSDDLRNPSPHVVTVWSDIGCPWATLTLHTLRAAARARGAELTIDHRAFPLELYNRRPTPKLVLDAEIVALGAMRPEVGFRLWDADPAQYPVSTLPALEAVQAAKADAIGGLAASDQLDEALRTAMYAERRCISVLPEIEDVAAACPDVDEEALMALLYRGVGRSEVHAQWLASHSDQVQGSPQVFVGDLSLHNPGVTYRWTASPEVGGLPHFTDYSTDWADDVLAAVAQT